VATPSALCPAPRLGLLVGLAENYTPEHPRAAGDRLRECPKGVARRHGLAIQVTAGLDAGGTDDRRPDPFGRGRRAGAAVRRISCGPVVA